MAELRRTDWRIVDQAFGLGRENPKGPGYVLDFSDATMPEWFADEVGVEIDDARYRFKGTSKANRLRAFVGIEPNAVVARMMRAL